MRLIPFNREKHRCDNCYVWFWDGKTKSMGKKLGECRFKRSEVSINFVPEFGPNGVPLGMRQVRSTAQPQLHEDEWCYDHVPFPN